jgi:hypothetical protein
VKLELVLLRKGIARIEVLFSLILGNHPLALAFKALAIGPGK